MILRPSVDPIKPSDGVMRILAARPGDDAGDIACLVHGESAEDAANNIDANIDATDNRRGDVVDDLVDDGPLVLKFPGNAGRAERSSSFPLAVLRGDDVGSGGSVWTWNPPGYGSSDGPASLATYAPSAIAFADRVYQATTIRAGAERQSRRRIFLCGNSMGCCAAIHIAARWQHRDQIAGLILRNPPPLNLVVMRIANRYPMGKMIRPIAESLPRAMNAIHEIVNVDAPVVWIACQDDSLVPISLQSKIFEKHPGIHDQVLLAGLDHNESPDAAQTRQICEAISKMVQRDR